MKIIAFSGRMQSGKTTAAEHAIHTHGGTKLALADAVKEEVAEFLGIIGAPFAWKNLYGTAESKAEIFSALLGTGVFGLIDVYMFQLIYDYVTLDRHGLKLQMSYRTLLQLWGTEYRRKQSESYWTDRMREKLERTEGLIFIDDVRFPDEVEMVQNAGGIVVRLERPSVKKMDHASETALDGYRKFDMTVINDGGLDEFKDRINGIMKLVGP